MFDLLAKGESLLMNMVLNFTNFDIYPMHIENMKHQVFWLKLARFYFRHRLRKKSLVLSLQSFILNFYNIKTITTFSEMHLF